MTIKSQGCSITGNVYDSIHEVVKGIFLKGGAELHRFTVIGPEDLKAGQDPVEYSAIYINGEEYSNNPRKYEGQLITDWNKYGCEIWRNENDKPRKVKGCIYPNKYGCKGCEYNEVPDLRDGGCLIYKASQTGVRA